jgi:hypothetical protein
MNSHEAALVEIEVGIFPSPRSPFPPRATTMRSVLAATSSLRCLWDWQRQWQCAPVLPIDDRDFPLYQHLLMGDF